VPDHRADLLGVDAPNLQLRGVWAGDPEAATYVQLHDVKALEVRSHAWGAVEGLGVGLLTGAVAGAFVGYTSEDAQCFVCFSAKERAVLGGIGFGLTGALVGVVLGAIVGHVDRYEF
jgi:hypothetical protein